MLRPVVSALKRPIKLAIVNDYGVVVAGVAHLLAPFRERIHVIELDANLPVAAEVDIALYDTFARTEPGLAELKRLVENPLVHQVLVFTWSFAQEQVDRAFEVGADGYLSKTASAEQIVDAVERTAAGGRIVIPAQGRSLNNPDLDWPGKSADLTAREAEVLALITQGRSNIEIAELLHLSVNTIKSTIRTAYRTIGVTNRVQAVLWGTKNGMGPDVARLRAPETG